MKPASCLILPMALLLLASACSPTQKVAELSDDYKKFYTDIAAYESLPVRRLSWQEALAKLEKGNLEYREQKRQYENSKHQRSRTFRSLIPLLDAGYYYNAPLRWGEGYPAQSNFNLNIFFNLPQLVQLPIEHYTDALAVIKADTDCKLKKRELDARLYQSFREHALLNREQALQRESSSDDETARALDEKMQAEKKRQEWGKLCALLNDYSARWEPDCKGMPTISLAHYRKQFQTPDELFLANIALQAEAARLNRLGVFIRFMPTAQINFYSPSLFTASGGNLDGFMRNADDVRVNLNSYISFDTRLERCHDYKDAKESEKLTLEMLRQNLREHKQKVESVLQSWEEYEKWELGLREYIAFRNTQGVEDMDEALARHQESQELERELIEQERANLERECGAIQEYGWRNDKPQQLPRH